MKAWVARGWLLLGGALVGCGDAGGASDMTQTPGIPPAAMMPGCAPGGCAGAAAIPPSTAMPDPSTGAVTTPPVTTPPVTTPTGMPPTTQPPMGQAGSAAMQPPPTTQPPVAADGWEMLVTSDWELAPNEERYFCQRVTLKEDLYVNGIKAVNPAGTHHTALTAAASAGMPDGLTECNSNGLLPQGIFGSGVGTAPVMYPAGVGLKLRAGQQLLLNLHVFNVTAQRLRGTSGTAVLRAKPEDVKNLAESLLAGPARFSVPVGRSSVKGKCTMTHDTKLFAVQPHMHQTGVHMKGVAHSSEMGDVTVHDGAFNFENQLVYAIDEVPMKQGDTVDVECTFDNQTDKPISFGESSNQEMCFLVLHRYPAAANPSVSCFR